MNTIFFRSEKVLSLLFAHIARVYGDPACESANGEVWQYMGTWGHIHQFRHRDLPDVAAKRGGVPPGRTYYNFITGDALRKRVQIQPVALGNEDRWSYMTGYIRRGSQDIGTLVMLDNGCEKWFPTERVKIVP